MARKDGIDRLAEGEEAKRRLAAAIARSRRLLSQYRTRLLLLRRTARTAGAARPG